MTGLAREITLALGGDWHGHYGLVPGPGHSRRDRSLKIAPHPRDPGDIIVHSFSGDDWRECKGALRSLGLLPPRDCNEAAQHGGDALQGRFAEPRRSDAEDHKRKAEAVARIIAIIVSETVRIYDTPADHYLQRRGLRPPFPESLRFHPALRTRDQEGKPLCCPGMVALVAPSPGADPVAIHRTFLTVEGHKHPSAKNVKAMLGPCKGGAVWPELTGEALGVAEGIETALSFTRLTGLPCAAALSAGLLKHVPVATAVADLTLVADNDANGVGLAAALAAAQTFWKPWRRTRVFMPEKVGLDFNDKLLFEWRRHG